VTEMGLANLVVFLPLSTCEVEEEGADVETVTATAAAAVDE